MMAGLADDDSGYDSFLATIRSNIRIQGGVFGVQIIAASPGPLRLSVPLPSDKAGIEAEMQLQVTVLTQQPFPTSMPLLFNCLRGSTWNGIMQRCKKLNLSAVPHIKELELFSGMFQE